jgi:hypothetical protein
LLGCGEPSKKTDSTPQVSTKIVNRNTSVGYTNIEKVKVDGQIYLVFYHSHSLFVIKQDLTPEEEVK